jgi:hypothetical protein
VENINNTSGDDSAEPTANDKRSRTLRRDSPTNSPQQPRCDWDDHFRQLDLNDYDDEFIAAPGLSSWDDTEWEWE